MSQDARTILKNISRLWELERRASIARFEQARRERSLRERVASGIALRALALSEVQAAAGDRSRLWLTPTEDDLLDFSLSPGTPLLLWSRGDDDADALRCRATLWRVERDRVGVYVDGDPPEWMETPGFNLDEDAPQVTFERGARAIKSFLTSPQHHDEATLREILFGASSPRFVEADPGWTPRDASLNDAQRVASARALAASHIALIHGPPGTGKTRTLIEVILQSTSRGEQVLASAASNLAVDNLAERLVDAGAHVIRLGHPARVSSNLAEHTLDAALERDEFYQLARSWMDEANALRARIQTRYARGSLSRRERREQLAEVWSLMRDARTHIQRAQRAAIERAEVVCATAAGAASSVLGGRRFDLVVLDEATQAADPIALIPMARAPRAVLAGDPCQLPPTILSQEAARQGLATTLFERLAHAHPEAVTMLVEQYRMHEDIMRFPSAQMYDGALVAHQEVAHHTLEEIGVAQDMVRATPLVFIDTAGKGWEDVLDEETRSRSNPEQAEQTASEARALLARGARAADVAIITPYDAQARLLRRLLEDEHLAGLEISTVDGFQGREKEAIIVDLVRGNLDADIGFLQDVRRMNVALTRARRALIVIGDSATIGAHPFYAAFLEAAQTHGTWISAWSL